MLPLTPSAQQAVQELAQRYGVSVDAVSTLLSAVSLGNGSMAQFYHPELGGGGQWMRGGMTMVGDMFNGRLQSTVSGLCSELSSLLAAQQVFVVPPQQEGSFGSVQSWWPVELGQPSSSGGQNDTRYAYFPGAHRLAVSRGGQVTVYDTLDHQIGGVQQQQGGPYGSQSFTSQFGTFTVESLPIVSPAPPSQAPLPSPSSGFDPHATLPSYAPPPSYASDSNPGPSSQDIIGQIERLAQLHLRGILSDDEFRTKKAELLSRL
ncbi:MAG TPA: SHOCT domain-containing protein [Polyangiaceae bacterium]|nr:SHOCT domain-containing protein [Polyangiaceae bacterium]